MRSLIPRKARGSDPAPSKWHYRMQRLWLTPMFRRLVRTGIPGFAVAAAAIWYLADEGRQQGIVDGWESMVRAVQDRPEFMVGLLRIEGAGPELQDDIQEALPVSLPVSQFALDLGALRDALRDLDAVADAEVRIKSGGVLLLKVTEREPVVAWLSSDGVEVLDAEGRRVGAVDDLAQAGALPLIAGEGAEARVAEALRLVEAAQPVADRLVGLTRVGSRRWDVVLTRGQRILLPEAAPAAALDRSLALHAAEQILDRDVRVVDLRLPGRTVLRLSPVARDELAQLQDLERLSYTEDR